MHYDKTMDARSSPEEVPEGKARGNSEEQEELFDRVFQVTTV